MKTVRDMVAVMVNNLLARHGGDLGRAGATLEGHLRQYPRSGARQTTQQMLDEVRRRLAR